VLFSGCILDYDHDLSLSFQDFVKFIMFDFFVYMLGNYEKYFFFEWVGPYLVRIRSLRLMEFITKIV